MACSHQPEREGLYLILIRRGAKDGGLFWWQRSTASAADVGSQ